MCDTELQGGFVKKECQGDYLLYGLSAKLAQLMSSDEIKELRNHFNILDIEKDQSSEYSEVTLKKRKVKKVLTILKERGILYPNKANALKTLFDNLGCLTTSKLSGPIRLYQKFANVHGDMPQCDQPTVNAGCLNDSVLLSPSHEILEGRFLKQENWRNQNLINVVNTTHGLVCYVRSGKKREPNVLTQLFKLPKLDSSDNYPQVIYSKVISRQGFKKLFLTFIDETHLVMCYNKTLQIIDINSKELVREHQLHATAKTMDVEEGEIFVVVGDSSEVLVFSPDLEEIAKLTFNIEGWKYPADMKVTSGRLFIICKVKPRDHDGPYNWPDRALSFRREDGEMEANYTFPGEQYTEPVSIAAHKESEFVGVLWSKKSVWGWRRHHSINTCMVSLYTLSGHCVFLLDVKLSHGVQILNKSTMIVINQTDGLKFYNMAHFFTSNVLAIRLSSFITLPECTGLQNFYGISDDEINRKDSGSSQFGNLTSIRRRFLHLFKILEDKDLVGPSKFDDFIAADAKVRALLLWSHVESYWKLLAETGIMKRASLEAGPSVQVHVPVTQEGVAENLVNISSQEGTSAQSHSLYPGGSHPKEPTSLQPQQQHHQQLQQAKQPTHWHDQEHPTAFQQDQVTQQQLAVTLDQQAQRHAGQEALRQHSLLHRQQLYQQQWQQSQPYQKQLQVHQEGLGYSQVQQYQQPVGYRHSLGVNQQQAVFAQQFLNRPAAFNRQQLPAIYNQDGGVLYNQQQAADSAQIYSHLPGGSAFEQHQQEQYATLPYQQQQQHEPLLQEQELQQYPLDQPQTSFQHQVVAPSHVELGQHAYAEHMTGRQRIISPSSSQHHQQKLQYQATPGPLPVIEGSIVRDKRSLFLECLKEKLASLSQTNSFTPWGEFFRWKSTDLFVSCWLTLNDRKPMKSVKNIEDQCKLKCIEIFTHDRLKPETRIIIEGGPGTGKTMLLAQLALDWSKGKTEHVDILIFLPLKIVKNKTLIQAIKEFYIPENIPLSGNDIADIFSSDTEKICFLLDGLEEYSDGREMRPKESSEVMKVIKKEKYPDCKVVVTCRSYFMHDLSDVPLLRIGQFGETERKSFIQKLSLDNIKKEEKMKQVIEDDSFLLSLCSIPLLFALAVHNIESMSFAGDSHIDKVAPFIKNMVETLWASSMSETWSEKELLTLGELAFNGLCKSQQQFWPKNFIESKISGLKQWLDCRVLVLERDMGVHPGTKFQDIAENYERCDFEKMEHVTGKTETSQSLAQAETQQHKEDGQGRETLSNEATVRIRFLHEIIQKWFAATYLSSMMNPYTDEDQFHEYVINQLHQLSPKDQRYVLRFTSYLYPRSCHAIINYLLTNFLSDDGSIEPHVMDCICLCFAEHNGIKGTDIKNSVTEVCKEVITIDFEDGRFLQKAKSSFLQYASDCEVIIEEVQLSNVISAVDETSFTLNSGTKLGQLNTLQVIEVSQWDGVLHQDDFKNILKFLSKGNSIKTIICVFPCHPPKILDEVIIENVISKNLEVEWNNGEVIWTLDPKKQIFIPMFGTMRKAGQIELKNKEDDFMSNEQYLMSLPGTSSTPFGKWPTKRPSSKRLHSDMKLDIAAKRLKMNWDFKLKSEKGYKKEEVFDLSEDSMLMNWDFKLKSEKGYKKEEVFDLSEDSMLEEPSTSSPEETFVKEETSSQGFSQAPIKQETADSDSQDNFWAMNHAGLSEQNQVTVYLDRSLLQAQASITQFGGTVEIPDTGVVLKVPPNALPEGMQGCLIKMKILPISMLHHEATSFSSNSSVRVELLPNHFKFRCHVELTLPHCLELKKNVVHRARVFMSHHNEGERPKWEEQKEQLYHLREETCITWLKSFCWIKYEIGDEIVEGKRLKIYTAAEKMNFGDQCAVVHVGYHLDIPGEQEILRMNPNLILQQRHPFLFLREGKHSLLVRLLQIIPSQWKYSGENPKEISFQSVAASIEDSCTFIINKETNNHDIPMCVFVASQKQRNGTQAVERKVDLWIRPEAHSYVSSSSSNGLASSGNHLHQDAKKSLDESIKLFTQAHSYVSSSPSNGLASSGNHLHQDAKKSLDESIKLIIQQLSRKLIADEWEFVGMELGLQNADLYRIKQDSSSTHNAIYKMLEYWRQIKGPEATYSTLINSLRKVGRTDLAKKVQNLKDFFEEA